MIDIEELEDKFSIEGEVGFAELEEGFPVITVVNKFAEADISLYGAQVINFRPYSTLGILWMSPESLLEEGRAIRGGIPVCFPWFGPHKNDKSKPQHGFARLMYWNVVETQTLQGGETLVRLQLNSSEKTKIYWPHDFCAEIIVEVGKSLTVTLKITNTSSETFEYTDALHSYYTLSGIDNITIDGLQNTKYLDNLTQGESMQVESLLKIDKEVDRNYLDTEAPCIIQDEAFNRKIVAAKSGSKVTTVWNPWEETCRKIGDMPDDAYQTFVCIEAVNSGSNTIKLAPGESHEMSAIIGLGE